MRCTLPELGLLLDIILFGRMAFPQALAFFGEQLYICCSEM